MFDLVLGHSSFLGHTGYAHHSREFFTELNKRIPVRIRNFAYVDNLDYLTQIQKDMVIYQKWNNAPYEVGTPFERNPKDKVINIILNETNHYYYYDKYDGPKIAYNVWESTLQPEQFFKKLLEFDQLWVPTTWQRDCSIGQGFPAARVKIIPEGIDGNKFCPGESDIDLTQLRKEEFNFVLFGRWDNRKSTTEIIRAFLNEFKVEEPVNLYLHIDNPWGERIDGFKTTQERMVHYGFDPKHKRLILLHGLENADKDDLYINYLRNANCFVSCAKAEGWNIPLIQGISVGTPTISSNYGAQLDFAGEASHLVNIKKYVKPYKVFMQDDNTPGLVAQPDYEHLQFVMRDIYNNYNQYKQKALEDSIIIREKFSWEKAADKAMVALEELYQTCYPPRKRLNIGCGNDIKDGYINIDEFVENNSITKMSMLNLDFAGNFIDEIYTSHSLEHFGKDGVKQVLKECYRVLKTDGILKIEVPNLEKVLQNWLDTKEEDRWGFPLDTIFGIQDNPGEFHKTGFTKQHLIDTVKQAGFDIDEINDVYSHAQDCIELKAHKINIRDNSVIIVDCYPDTDEKQDLLVKQIIYLKQFRLPILLTTHYSDIPREIIDLVDYIVYDRKNILSDDSIDFFFVMKDFIKIKSKVSKKYHSVAVHTNLKNALKFCKDKFRYAHFIEYDTSVDFSKHLQIAEKSLFDVKACMYSYDEEQKGIRQISNDNSIIGLITNLMSFDIKWFDDNLADVNSWEEYKNITLESSKKLNKYTDLIYENWMYDYFKSNNLLKNIGVIDNETKNKIIKERSKIVSGKFEDDNLIILLSETNQHDVLIFAINDYKDHKVDYRFTCNGKVTEGQVPTNGFAYYVANKIDKVQVMLDTKVTDLEFDYTKLYSLTTRFKFVDDRIKCFEWTENDDNGFTVKKDVPVSVKYHFVDGAFVEILGNNEESKDYTVEFIDQNDNNKIIFSTNISPNNWTRPNLKYFINWKTLVKHKNKIIFEHLYNAKDKRILINIDSKALGDTIAWMPYLDEFRKKHECKVIATTFWNTLFKDTYPEIEFFEPGQSFKDLYAQYIVGVFDGDYNHNKIHWRSGPLQKVASDILGLDYKEVIPKISVVKKEREIKEKYVAISQHSTFQCKFWIHAKGWQFIIDYLNSIGYKVVVVSLQKPLDIINVVDYTGRSIPDTINIIKNSEFFIGVSSGLSWLAWALNIPTILISGYSSEWAEMNETEKAIRVINKNVCNSCWQDISLPIDRGNFNWCPRNKDMECTKEITSQMVIEAIEKIKDKK